VISAGVDDGYASAGEEYASASEGGYWSAAESVSSFRSGSLGGVPPVRRRPASASSDSDDEVTDMTSKNAPHGMCRLGYWVNTDEVSQDADSKHVSVLLAREATKQHGGITAAGGRKGKSTL